jgi:hypothetical protein
MTAVVKNSPERVPLWAVLTVITGLLIVALAGAGLLILESSPGVLGAAPDPRPTLDLPVITLTPMDNASLSRGIVAVITPLPVPTSTPTATPLPLATAPVINWSEEEKNALSWLCYAEVRGLREHRDDACLSVISTVRARYAYNSGFKETDVVSTLLREDQFPIEFYTDRPAPIADFYNLVELYQYGARGSCNGYLYYDSVPGGPSLCVLTASNGQFIEFHNGW